MFLELALAGNVIRKEMVMNIRDYIFKYMLLEDFDNISLYFLGSWCSFAAWLTVFILMITLRQHLKAHLTDESMWGSQYGGNKSRRSGSRMSERSFDA